MKSFLKFSFIVLICSIFSCESNDPDASPEIIRPATPEELDALSDRLQFTEASKKSGSIPAVTTSRPLQVNVRDTLYLLEGVQSPVKFLHDNLTSVGGVLIQVHQSNATTNTESQATYYYDVPEHPSTETDDSLSVVFVGFDTKDADLPLTFDITMTPYDENGQPLASTTMPVSVGDLNNDTETAEDCGLVNLVGETWKWELTSFSGLGRILDPSVGFGGQEIQGCCINGISSYTFNCPEENKKKLYFPSGYLREYESLTFNSDGTYSRITRESSSNPDPTISNFCSGTEGVVVGSTFIQNSRGTWIVEKNVQIPNNPFSYLTADVLTLTPTFVSPSGGFSNRGGIIHQLDCDVNSLVLWVRDPEGGKNDVFTFFSRSTVAGSDEEEWYPFL